MSRNYTGLSALYDKLSDKCKEVYEGAEIIDPSCGYEIMTEECSNFLKMEK